MEPGGCGQHGHGGPLGWLTEHSEGYRIMITQGMCTSFKAELLEGIHVLTAAGDTIKLALYDSTATLSPATTAYSATGEITEKQFLINSTQKDNNYERILRGYFKGGMH